MRDNILTEIKKLRDFLTKSKASFLFIKCFLTGIDLLSKDLTILFPYSVGEFQDEIFQHLYRVFMEQTTIGWKHVLRDQSVNPWFLAHHMYMQQPKCQSMFASGVFLPCII